ncbi:MAG: hypothetical protein ACQGVK_03685 [Myxococcota bacterium]
MSTSRPQGAWRVFLESWVAPYVRDPTLWPVLIVVVVHLIAFLAPALLLSVRDGGIGSSATIAVSAGATTLAVAQEWRIRGRPAELSWVLLASWLASAGLAWVADRHDLF